MISASAAPHCGDRRHDSSQNLVVIRISLMVVKFYAKLYCAASSVIVFIFIVFILIRHIIARFKNKFSYLPYT